MLKPLLILAALALGLAVPALADYTAVIRPFLMTLLFFSFLGVALSREIFARQQAVAAALLIPTGLAVFALGQLYGPDLALTLLLMGLAPTAVITPVLAEMMNRRADYMVGSILVTHAVFALAVPLLLPRLLGVELGITDLLRLLVNIGGTILLPLAAAQGLRRFAPALGRRLRRLSPYAFVLFLINVAVAAGSLSRYLRYESSAGWAFVLWTIGTITLLVIVNFAVGGWLARPGQRVEGSLTLGRKNTMLSIWIALEYVNPLVVLGPMLYILVQNVLVAGQIWYVARMDSSLVR